MSLQLASIVGDTVEENEAKTEWLFCSCEKRRNSAKNDEMCAREQAVEMREVPEEEFSFQGVGRKWLAEKEGSGKKLRCI